MNKFKSILLFIWQLPQNLAGCIIKLFTKKCGESTAYDIKVNHWKLHSGISLGKFIFVHDHASKNTVLHEHGHQIQSLYLGPLYLLVIGLPSFAYASLRTFGLFKDKDYYAFYTEKWADKLGGVKRKKK